MVERRLKAENDPERWQRQWEIFDRALPLDPAARVSLLDEQCGDDLTLRREIESLLEAHGEDDSLMREPWVDLRSALPEALPKPQIDRYELLESLGSGGMGQVFSARRADGLHDELVAVKVLKRGLDTDALIQRFATERRILARLAHPHIAHLLDGGSTHDGRPYLVMEKVEGSPIDRYCDARRLSVSERLALFQCICKAVHFAHQNLVIHRDLKPSNILISDDGLPKLLDFGIAKLLVENGAQISVTDLRSRPMTPQYASPEQILGRTTTTAGDIYSLGMLLHLLLCGDLPYRLQPDVSPAEQIRHRRVLRPSQRLTSTRSEETGDLEEICANRGTTPASLRKALQGDLDNIILMALAEQPEDRYASAEAFADDLERLKKGLPVRARADSMTYRTRKFVGRHQMAMALGAGILGALLILISLLWIQSRQLLDERDRVVSERNRATAVSDFLVELFAIPDPTRAQGETVTARRLLERGIDQIETDLASEPGVRSSLMLTMGRSLAGLGLYEEASTLLRRSLELHQNMGLDDEEGLAEASLRLGEVLSLTGQYEQAEPLFRRTLDIRRRAPEPNNSAIAEVHLYLGDLAAKQGRFDRAETEFTTAERLVQPTGHEELKAKILDRHATLLQDRGDFEGALILFDQALAFYRRAPAAAGIALCLNNSAWLAAERADFDRADRLYREAEAIQRRLFDEFHPQLATTLANRGLLSSQRGDLDQAEELLSQALAMYRESLGTAHPKVAITLNNLASVETQREDFEAAEDHYGKALEIQQRTLGPNHAETANTLNNLAQVLALTGKLDQAKGLFERALSISRQELGPKHPQVGAVLCNLAEIIQQRGDLETALTLFRQAVEILRQSSDQSPNLAAALTNFAALQQEQGDLTGAAITHQEAVGVMRKALGDSHPDVAKVLIRLAFLHSELGDHATAADEAQQALAILHQKAPTAEAWITAAESIRSTSGKKQGPSDSQ